MKVVAVTDTESLSGAGIAALRIHRALGAAGVASAMAVARKGSVASDVGELNGPVARRLHAARRFAMKNVLRACGARDGEPLSANLLPTGMHHRINRLQADVLHLHWVGLEMLRIEEIARIRKPLVWTMHDEWFALGLEHYATAGGSGPDPARSELFRRMDRSVRRRKAAAWSACAPEIVCPSHWLADRMRSSGLIDPQRVHVISNTVPLDVFQPADRAAARSRLGLPQDRPVIGMGALKALDDPRKGYAHLRDALAHLAGLGLAREPIVLVFGGDGGTDLPLRAQFAGTVTGDAELAALYAAMDVFVCPSRQENLPNTIAEASGCGVPTVAFEVGGIPDLVTHGVTGYLARPFDARDLAEGVLACIAPGAHRDMAVAARALACRQLDGASVAARYAAVFGRAMERAAR